MCSTVEVPQERCLSSERSKVTDLKKVFPRYTDMLNRTIDKWFCGCKIAFHRGRWSAWPLPVPKFSSGYAKTTPSSAKNSPVHVLELQATGYNNCLIFINVLTYLDLVTLVDFTPVGIPIAMKGLCSHRV